MKGLQSTTPRPPEIASFPALGSYLSALEHLLPTAVSYTIEESSVDTSATIADAWSVVIPLPQEDKLVLVRIDPSASSRPGCPPYFWRKPSALRMLKAMERNLEGRGKLHKWPDAVRAAWSLISMHPCRQMSVREVAACLKLSAGYVGARVEHILGSSFNNLLRDERVAAACRLLIESDLRISEIPERVGGLSISQFNRNFSAATGFSPTAYRQRFRDAHPQLDSFDIEEAVA
jgi:AraC-like DNA-binding protein